MSDASVPARDVTVRFAREVIALTSPWFPGRPGPSTPEHFVLASGFLARCRTLLSGMATLVEHDECDSIGALYRPLLETYLSGVYALLGGDDAADVLHASFKHLVHQINVAHGNADRDSRPPDARILPLSRPSEGDGLVERVSALLTQVNDAYAEWARRAYDSHYRSTSLMDAHGSIGCLRGYRQPTDDGGTIINPTRGNPELATFFLNHAIALVLGFAGVWASRVGKNVDALSDLHARWVATQPENWELPEREATVLGLTPSGRHEPVEVGNVDEPSAADQR